MNVYTSIIFITGAATLALELLASRIMTPYFGVSLFIWTGILSITLISLALGYFLGGKLSNSPDGAADKKSSLEFLFLLMPAISSISISIACLLYPWVFFRLAQTGLILGSFIACIILLMFPLVTLSSMNPLLIAIRTASNSNVNTGDSDSGLVFFISTIGSVIGIWITAFLFIPNITNFRSVLILAFSIALIALIFGYKSNIIQHKRKQYLILISLVGLFLSGTLFGIAPGYLKKNNEIAHNGFNWKIEKEYSSLFGNTKILSITTLNAEGDKGTNGPMMPLRMYYQDGIMQNLIDRFGQSPDIYPYALEILSTANLPEDAKILVLGLAGGIVPMKIGKQNIKVDVVEINPNSLIAAIDYFGFNPSRATVYQMDARSFVKQCQNKYNRIIVDLFQGDGVPDYLLSRNFFHDLKNCITPNGAIVLNTFTMPQYMQAYYHILKTIKSEFKQLYMFHDDLINQDVAASIYLVAGNQGYKPGLNLRIKRVPQYIQQKLTHIFSKNRPIDKQMLADASIISDEYNVFPIININNAMGYRRIAINTIPYEFLVN